MKLINYVQGTTTKQVHYFDLKFNVYDDTNKPMKCAKVIFVFNRMYYIDKQIDTVEKTIVYGQEEWKIRDKESVLELIDELNKNPNCIWIMIQLPLPDNLKEYKTLLLQAITPEKDVDGLWGTLVGKSFFNFLNFIPATPKAVLTLLDYYDLWEVKNKKVAILWQSTIVWKPLALELLKRGAQIACFDINNTPWEIKTYCQSADYIFSATGHIHLIDESYLSWKNNPSNCPQPREITGFWSGLLGLLKTCYTGMRRYCAHYCIGGSKWR